MSKMLLTEDEKIFPLQLQILRERRRRQSCSRKILYRAAWISENKYKFGMKFDYRLRYQSCELSDEWDLKVKIWTACDAQNRVRNEQVENSCWKISFLSGKWKVCVEFQPFEVCEGAKAIFPRILTGEENPTKKKNTSEPTRGGKGKLGKTPKARNGKRKVFLFCCVDWRWWKLAMCVLCVFSLYFSSFLSVMSNLVAACTHGSDDSNGKTWTCSHFHFHHQAKEELKLFCNFIF